VISGCKFGDCPKVLLDDKGNLLVQGYRTDVPKVPDGEAVVRVPRDVIIAATEALHVEASGS
jgi:hypothetical protein